MLDMNVPLLVVGEDTGAAIGAATGASVTEVDTGAVEVGAMTGASVTGVDKGAAEVGDATGAPVVGVETGRDVSPLTAHTSASKVPHSRVTGFRNPPQLNVVDK